MKPHVKLQRLETGSKGTFGVISVGPSICCLSLEPPMYANMQDVSCIPEGTYNCIITFAADSVYPRIEILDVPERTGILIHAGNYLSETKGCILPGLMLEDVNSNKYVAYSGKALSNLLTAIGYNENKKRFTITIINNFN